MAQRPFTTLILAMSADGKIADRSRSAARFGSPHDKAHLERQIAQADGVVFGAATLRAYGTTLRVSDPALLALRQNLGKPLQPVQIVCSESATFDLSWPFFQQPVPRWLLTTDKGRSSWQAESQFEKILVAERPDSGIDWPFALGQLQTLGLKRLAVLGGGTLAAGLLAEHLLDEIWLTVCPLVLGGVNAPTPVEGTGFLQTAAPQLQLLETIVQGQEVFLHYRVL